MDIALIQEMLLQHYLSDTRDMKTVRNIIDYQYKVFTEKVQLFECILVIVEIMAFMTRLFVKSYADNPLSNFQRFGE